MVDEDTSITSFFNNNINGNIGHFTNLKIQMDSLYSVDSITSNNIQTNLDVIGRNSISVSLNDSLVLLDTTLSQDDIDVLEAETGTFLDSIITSTNLNIELFDSLKIVFITKADSISANYSNIITTTTLEENEKAVSIIYLSTVALQEWDQIVDFEDELNNVALQCSNTGGSAVHKARNLLGLINDSLYYNDIQCEDTCSLPNNPDTISGPAFGQCGQTGVSYTIDSVPYATNYSWTVSDTNYAHISGASNLNSVSIDFDSSFIQVSIFVTANNSCGSSDPAAIVIYGIPQRPDSITGNISVCASTQEIYTTSVVTGATGYDWTVPSGSSIIGNSGPSITLLWGSSDGNILVRALNNCDTSDACTLHVDMTCRLSKINSEATVAKLYPNPSSGKMILEYNILETSAQLQITNGVGNEVKIFKLDPRSNKFEFDLSDLPSGVYQYQIFNKNETIIRDKFVLMRIF